MRYRSRSPEAVFSQSSRSQSPDVELRRSSRIRSPEPRFSRRHPDNSPPRSRWYKLFIYTIIDRYCFKPRIFATVWLYFIFLAEILHYDELWLFFSRGSPSPSPIKSSSRRNSWRSRSRSPMHHWRWVSGKMLTAWVEIVTFVHIQRFLWFCVTGISFKKQLQCVQYVTSWFLYTFLYWLKLDLTELVLRFLYIFM